MIIIIDSNILFSALIKDSLTRKLIYETDYDLILPEIVFEELRKYKEELVRKTRLSEEEFDKTLRLILKYVRIIPTEQIKHYRNEAWEIIKDHSPEDVMFIACALAFDGSILWSDDKKLKIQNKIKVFDTAEIIIMLK